MAPADGAAGDDVSENVDSSRYAPRDSVRAPDVDGVEDHVLVEGPGRMTLLTAVRYVLSVPTNRVLIVVSALGYFFFTGVQTFAVVLIEQQFGVGQTVASLLIGLVAALGADRCGRRGARRGLGALSHGHASARVTVAAACYAAACYAVACASLAPALVAPTLLIGIPLYFLGTGAITVDNPPLDASRLDVIPSRLWCRAEGVRTLGRHTATALAPLAFGMSSSSSAPGAGSASLAPAADRAEVTCRAPSS